jgi:hypothetical protein
VKQHAALVEHAVDPLDLSRIVAARIYDHDLIIGRRLPLVGVPVGVCSCGRDESEGKR